MQFTQRIGRSTRRSSNIRLGFYWSDDIRINSESLAWRRRAQRDAVAHRRQAEPDAAPRLHLDAVRQPDRGSRRLRPLLRLVRVEPLRPDAARQRRRAARSRDQRYRRASGTRGAKRCAPARIQAQSGPRDAERAPGVARGRASGDAESHRSGDVSDAARARSDALDQRQRARVRGDRPRHGGRYLFPTRSDGSATSHSSTRRAGR